LVEIADIDDHVGGQNEVEPIPRRVEIFMNFGFDETVVDVRAAPSQACAGWQGPSRPTTQHQRRGALERMATKFSTIEAVISAAVAALSLPFATAAQRRLSRRVSA
jgi:hypothetical protein